MIEHLNKLFVAVILVSVLTYFERADYNLPLFVFILMLWDNAVVKQKTRMWYLMAVSLLVDFIWIVYWSLTWNNYTNQELGLCNFTIMLSCVNFVFKTIILVLTYVKVEDCKKAVSDITGNVKYVFSGPSDYQPIGVS